MIPPKNKKKNSFEAVTRTGELLPLSCVRTGQNGNFIIINMVECIVLLSPIRHVSYCFFWSGWSGSPCQTSTDPQTQLVPVDAPAATQADISYCCYVIFDTITKIIYNYRYIDPVTSLVNILLLNDQVITVNTVLSNTCMLVIRLVQVAGNCNTTYDRMNACLHAQAWNVSR